MERKIGSRAVCPMKAIVRVKPCTWAASIRDCREFLIQISGRRPILRSARRILNDTGHLAGPDPVGPANEMFRC